MKQFAIAVVCVFSATSAFPKDVTGKSYRFTVPDDVTFQSHEKLEAYTFRWGDPPLQLAQLILNLNPSPLTPKALKPMADMLEISFEDQLKRGGQVSDIQKKRTELDLGPFKGTEIEFIIKHASGITIRQHMFVLHDGDHAWNGQCTAYSTNDVEKARLIMKNAKKIANKELNAPRETRVP